MDKGQILEELSAAIQAASRKLGSKKALAKHLCCTELSLRRWESGEREAGLFLSATIFELADRPLLGGQTELYGRLTGLENKLTELMNRGAYGKSGDLGGRSTMEETIKDLMAGLLAINKAVKKGEDELFHLQRGGNGT